jgi:hypothetical protein
MERLALPVPLQGVFFDFLWDTRKVWLLPTESSIVAFDQLAWLLEFPVWTTVPGEARFDLSPRTVLEQRDRFFGSMGTNYGGGTNVSAGDVPQRSRTMGDSGFQERSKTA